MSNKSIDPGRERGVELAEAGEHVFVAEYEKDGYFITRVFRTKTGAEEWRMIIADDEWDYIIEDPPPLPMTVEAADQFWEQARTTTDTSTLRNICWSIDMKEHRTSLTSQEKLRVAVAVLIEGVPQHIIAALMGVNQGRINEAVVAVRKAIENTEEDKGNGSV